MKRTFITIIDKAKTYGYVKGVFNKGYFVYSNYVVIGSSKYNDTDDTKLNTGLLSLKNKNDLDEFLIKKKPVFVYIKQELITNPLKGQFLGEAFILNIEENIREEKEEEMEGKPFVPLVKK